LSTKALNNWITYFIPITGNSLSVLTGDEVVRFRMLMTSLTSALVETDNWWYELVGGSRSSISESSSSGSCFEECS
jgi:hypothetical protein